MTYDAKGLIAEAGRLLDNDLTLSLADLAKRLNVHRHTLHHHLIESTPEGFNSWRTSKRLQRAKYLLLNRPDLPIKQIAGSVGLTPARLTSLFNRTLKVTPTNFRRHQEVKALSKATDRGKDD